MRNPFEKVHWRSRFPEDYSWYEKFYHNLTYALTEIMVHPRKNFLNKWDLIHTSRIIKKGDILLLGNLMEASSLFMKSPLTHAGIYIGSKKVIWAIGDGVEIVSLNRVFRDYDTLTILRLPKKIKSKNKIIKKVLSFLKNQVGKPYNFAYEKRQDSYFCTQIINDAYKKAGYKTGLASVHKHKPKGKISSALYPMEFISKGKFEIAFLSHNLNKKGKKLIFVNHKKKK